MKYYATCDEANFDTATGVCSQVVYVQDGSGWLPELSNQDGAEIGAALFSLMALAYLFRFMFKKSG